MIPGIKRSFFKQFSLLIYKKKMFERTNILQNVIWMKQIVYEFVHNNFTSWNLIKKLNEEFLNV